MKVALAQINPTVGDIRGNADMIVRRIQEAKKDGAHLVVFPELAVCGYPPKDLLLRDGFEEDCQGAIDFIAKECVGITAVIGTVMRNYTAVGRELYNAAAVCSNGLMQHHYCKRLLPTYDIFDERRYFEPGQGSLVVPILGGGRWHRVGILICEDIWNEELVGRKLYHDDPVAATIAAGADTLVCLSASPFCAGKPGMREALMTSHAGRYGVPVIFVNQVGGNDDIVFDGHSAVVWSNRVATAAAFDEDLMMIDLDRGWGVPKNRRHSASDLCDLEAVRNALVLGVRDYVRKCGFSDVVIGLSGGIDSALTAVVAVEALGPEHVHGVAMPSRHSSEHSVDDARALAGNLGIDFRAVPIEPAHAAFGAMLSEQFVGLDEDVTEENIQARVRGNILMALSNKFGWLVLTTGNKSEMAVGYCVHGDNLIYTDSGIKTARDLYNVTTNRPVAIKDNRITAAHKSRKKSVVTITSRIGTTCRVSSDHEVKIYDTETGKTVFKRAEHLRKSDVLTMQIGGNIWGNLTLLPDFRYEKKEWDFRSYDFKPPSNLSAELAKFIGLCVADGCYCGGVYRIRSSKDEVAEFASRFLSSIDLPRSCWNITQKDERGCFFVDISSVQFVAWLKHLDIRHGAHKKTVPICILSAPPEIVKGFLSGVMLDASTNQNKKFCEVTYHSVSRDLAETVHHLLLNLGVLSYFRYRKAKYQQELYTYYEVYIPASQVRETKFEFLKPSLGARVKSNSENSRVKFKSFADNLYGHDEEVAELCRILGWSRSRSLRRRHGPIGRQTLLSYLNKLSDDEHTEATRRLSSAIGSGMRHVEITSIQKSECDEEMFDFTMDEEPEYSANGCVVHNCTIFGDMAGGLAVISDVPKTMVYDLSNHINHRKGREIIPENTIAKPASAELKPGQVDQDSLPPYETLDFILRLYVEYRKSPDNIWQALSDASHGRGDEFEYDKNSPYLIARKQLDDVIRRVDRNEYKRRQAAPGLRVTSQAFGTGWRFPIAAKIR